MRRLKIQTGEYGISGIVVEHHSTTWQKAFFDSQESDIFSPATDQFVRLIGGKLTRDNAEFWGLFSEKSGAELLVLLGEVPDDEDLALAIVFAGGQDKVPVIWKANTGYVLIFC